MSDSLTTLISKVQALLGDDGTIFTTATCTAGARDALKTYNQFLPVNAGTLITGVTNQYEYELTAEDSKAVTILDVLRQGTNNNEQDISITYDAYNEDERIFFRLRVPVTTSDTLIVRYTIPQTINGLDSEVESTIPAWIIPTLITGIAAETLRIRARSRTETINLSKDQSDNYLQQAVEMKTEYRADLVQAARSKRAPVGEPDRRAWNDNYHDWTSADRHNHWG
jgi:hypothetical protein